LGFEIKNRNFVDELKIVLTLKGALTRAKEKNVVRSEK